MPLYTIYLKLLATMLFWAGTFIVGRYLALHMAHDQAATWRFVIALVPLLVYWILQRRRQTTTFPAMSVRDWLAVIFMGATGVAAYNILFLTGLGKISASRAALIVSLSPIMTLIAMRFLGDERWSRRRLLGVSLSLTGVVIVISKGQPLAIFADGLVGLGELAILGAVFSWAAYTVIGRYVMRRQDSLSITLWSIAAGCLMLFLFSVSRQSVHQWIWPNWQEWLCLAYMGIFGTSLGFVWYNAAVRAIGAVKSAQFTNLVPVFAVILSVVLLNERPPLASLLGGVAVIVGVLLANSQNLTSTAVAGVR